MYDLDGETAIVTGATPGKCHCGAAQSGGRERRARGHAGRKVGIVADELADAGVTAQAVECDATDRADTDALAAQACDRFDTVEMLVNNAGIFTQGMLPTLPPRHGPKS